MRPDYAAVCGITVEEMTTQMSDYIDDFAEHRRTTRDEAIAQLKNQYDGYHFTWPSPDIVSNFLGSLQFTMTVTTQHHSVTIIIVDVDEFVRQPFTLHKCSVTY